MVRHRLANLSGSCTGPLPGLELQLQRRYTSMYALPDTTPSAAPGLLSASLLRC